MDTLLLPLSWWDMFPHQLAHSNEDAWARGLQVTSRARAREWLYLESVQINLLSANTHNSSGWRSGSGLYSSEGALAYYHDTAEAAGGRLLIADLDIKPAKVI